MSESDNYLKILEKISEVREDVGVLKNEMGHVKSDLCETREKLENINQQDIEQNKLLDKHILGVKTAMERLEVEKIARKQEHQLIQKQIEEIDARLKKTELLPNFLTALKRIAKWVSAVALAIVAVLKLLKVI